MKRPLRPETRKRELLAGAAACAALLAARRAVAQPAAPAAEPFPGSGIRVIVPFPPGGTNDIFARLLCDRLTRELGVAVVVDNRSGSGGLIGGAEAARAKPDGYTLGFHSTSSGIAGPLTRRNPPYTPERSFAPVAIVGTTPMVLGVNSKVPAKDLPELIALLRANPNKYSYASAGLGGTGHLATELLIQHVGNIEAVHVPYRGSAPGIQDLMAGNVAFMIDTFSTLLPPRESGEVRILAVLSRERAEAVPDVPTAVEQGVDVLVRLINFVVAPAGTPRERTEKLGAAIRASLAQPDLVAALRQQGFDPIADSGPAHATRFLAEEVALWKPVIEKAHIVIE